MQQVMWAALEVRWVATNAGAGVLVALCSVLLGPTLVPLDLMLLGLLQWLVIRRYGANGWWIGATALGAFLGLLLGFPLFALIQQGTSSLAATMGLSDSAVVLPPLAATFAVGGTTMGLAQARVQGFAGTAGRRWVLANAIGLAAYAVTALFLGATAYELLIPVGVGSLGLEGGQAVVGVTGGAVGGAVYGLVTATVLRGLPWHPCQRRGGLDR